MSMDSFTTVQSHCRKPSSFANAYLALSVISLGLLLIFSCDPSYVSHSQLTGLNATYVAVYSCRFLEFSFTSDSQAADLLMPPKRCVVWGIKEVYVCTCFR